MENEIPYCINGCGDPAIGEDLLGMLDEYEVVELKCAECLQKEEGK